MACPHKVWKAAGHQYDIPGDLGCTPRMDGTYRSQISDSCGPSGLPRFWAAPNGSGPRAGSSPGPMAFDSPRPVAFHGPSPSPVPLDRQHPVDRDNLLSNIGDTAMRALALGTELISTFYAATDSAVSSLMRPIWPERPGYVKHSQESYIIGNYEYEIMVFKKKARFCA